MRSFYKTFSSQDTMFDFLIDIPYAKEKNSEFSDSPIG